jgi:CBS domain containing-hemolysin-like protein
MMLIMVVACVVIFAALIFVAAIVPHRSEVGVFELKRRAAAGDVQAAAELQREAALVNVLSLRHVIQALFLVLFVTASVVAFGGVFGVIIALVVALGYSAAAQIGFVARMVAGQYERYEPGLIGFIEKHPVIFKFIKGVNVIPAQTKRLDSREELEYMVAQAGGLLSGDEKQLIARSLQFDSRRVDEIMTPSSVIEGIEADEVLGPLTLDDLHRTGHSRFPVIEKDLDHVIGMVYVRNLLTVDSGKTTPTARQAMEPQVFYIRNDQTLQHALAAFLKTHHHLFVVVNEFRETVGLLSLEDVIEALLGRKIIDEFDQHDDLRAVAARNPRGNNRPQKRIDV